MDAKEIVTVMKDLEKAESDSQIIKLLTLLQTDVVPTEKVLRETKVGVTVNRLRSHANPEVGTLVKKIIKTWKDGVSQEKKKKAVSSAGSPAKSATSTTTNERFVSKGPRTPKNDGVKVEIYENKTRNGSISAIYTALAMDSDEQPSKIFELVKDIEKQCFKGVNFTVDDTYRNKLRSLIMNLKNKNNPTLRRSILDHEIAPSKLVTMSAQELAPDSLKKEMEEIYKKNLFDAQGATENNSVTDRFECGKCKQRKVSYFQKQTRSADEPLTTFCKCENCGNRWKFS
ncbi:BA75_02010T0 [Komagataella pastoris]|uniref:Transcription elongation factor n=1 Tax=Komagataella pastoris TaxID=4922 RepID=A0A1B2JBK3_PICPA|nr:BA75_02010T0 [Komagataella pastoris]